MSGRRGITCGAESGRTVRLWVPAAERTVNYSFSGRPAVSEVVVLRRVVGGTVLLPGFALLPSALLLRFACAHGGSQFRAGTVQADDGYA